MARNRRGQAWRKLAHARSEADDAAHPHGSAGRSVDSERHEMRWRDSILSSKRTRRSPGRTSTRSFIDRSVGHGERKCLIKGSTASQTLRNSSIEAASFSSPATRFAATVAERNLDRRHVDQLHGACRRRKRPRQGVRERHHRPDRASGSPFLFGRRTQPHRGRLSQERLHRPERPGVQRVAFDVREGGPNYTSVFDSPLYGWISGVDVSEIGKRSPKTFAGEGTPHDDRASALHVTLPPGRAAKIDIINLFFQGDGARSNSRLAVSVDRRLPDRR